MGFAVNGVLWGDFRAAFGAAGGLQVEEDIVAFSAVGFGADAAGAEAGDEEVEGGEEEGGGE